MQHGQDLNGESSGRPVVPLTAPEAVEVRIQCSPSKFQGCATCSLVRQGILCLSWRGAQPHPQRRAFPHNRIASSRIRLKRAWYGAG